MMIYKQAPSYERLIQMQSCCWPTCIQMILFRHWIRIDQEQLAYDLWLVIEENNKPYYTLPFKVVPQWDLTHWLKFSRFEGEQIRGVLESFWFKSIVVYYSQFWDFERLIIENISKNNDIIVNFRVEWINDNGKPRWHFVVLSSYDSVNRIVTVCDPTSKSPKYREVEVDKLKESMSSKRNWEERWIIIIEKITKV